MEKTKEYEFLGNYIDEKGNMERQLVEVERKMYGMVKGIKQLGAEEKLGRISTEAALFYFFSIKTQYHYKIHGLTTNYR